eukprot:316732-Chlamydomonas_euryale.AAC.2
MFVWAARVGSARVWAAHVCGQRMWAARVWAAHVCGQRMCVGSEYVWAARVWAAHVCGQRMWAAHVCVGSACVWAPSVGSACVCGQRVCVGSEYVWAARVGSACVWAAHVGSACVCGQRVWAARVCAPALPLTPLNPGHISSPPPSLPNVRTAASAPPVPEALITEVGACRDGRQRPPPDRPLPISRWPLPGGVGWHLWVRLQLGQHPQQPPSLALPGAPALVAATPAGAAGVAGVQPCGRQRTAPQQRRRRLGAWTGRGPVEKRRGGGSSGGGGGRGVGCWRRMRAVCRAAGCR